MKGSLEDAVKVVVAGSPKARVLLKSIGRDPEGPLPDERSLLIRIVDIGLTDHEACFTPEDQYRVVAGLRAGGVTLRSARMLEQAHQGTVDEAVTHHLLRKR